jgi:hypothetical protein
MESYAQIHAVAPSPSVKESLFSKLGFNSGGPLHPVIEMHPQNKVVPVATYFNWAVAASVALLIGSVLFNVVYYTKYKNAETARENAEVQLLAQADENRSMQNDMGIIQSKYSEPVALHGLEASPDAAAKIFWMKNTGEVYVDPSNLPAAPSGKQYQLWAIVDGKPVDGGMLNTGTKGKYRIQKMKSFGRAEAFAITLETTGGNPTPKGEMYVMGKI